MKKRALNLFFSNLAIQDLPCGMRAKPSVTGTRDFISNTITYRYIDPSHHYFENCLLPWFSRQRCLDRPLAARLAEAALMGKSWKETIFKIMAEGSMELCVIWLGSIMWSDQDINRVPSFNRYAYKRTFLWRNCSVKKLLY